MPGRDQEQEDHGRDRRAAVERLHRRAAAELRAALPADQHPTCARWACAPTRPRRSGGRSRRPRSTRTSATTRMRCSRPSKRLGASFVLRGLITSQAARNPMMNVNQVSVGHAIHALGGNGRVISDAEAYSASYAGADVAAHGADARQRAGGRSRGAAVCGLLPQCRSAREGQALAAVAAAVVTHSNSTGGDRHDTKRTSFDCRACLLGAVLLARRPSSHRRSRRGATRRRPQAARRRKRRTPPPTRRSTSRSIYTNAAKKGPAVIVIPGEIKSNNATFLQKFTANNIADFGEIELSSANFQVLERSNLGPVAQRIRARLQPRRSGPGAQVPEDGQAEDAPSTSSSSTSSRPSRSLRRSRASTAARVGQMAGLLGVFAGSRGGAAGRCRRRHRQSVRCIRTKRRASGSSACATRSSMPRRPSRSPPATPRRRWKSARLRPAVLGVQQSQQGGVSLDTMVQRLVQKSVWDIDQKYK